MTMTPKFESLRSPRLIVLALVFASVGVAALALVARRADGPIGPFPGGALHGQMWRGPEPEWSFATDLDTIEVEVNPGDPRSGLTGVIVHDGKVYVPTTLVPIKRWHRHVLEDSRVIVRIGSHLYRRCATRVTDPKLLETLINTGQAKYGPPYHATWAASFTWYWHLDSPEHCFATLNRRRR